MAFVIQQCANPGDLRNALKPERDTDVVTMVMYFQRAPLSHHDTRSLLRKKIPEEFQTNFVLLNHWISTACQRLSFTKKEPFSSWVTEGVWDGKKHVHTNHIVCKAIPRILEEVKWITTPS
eukprot:PhF_6_TR26675/c1_g1_i1/m.38784